MVNHKINFERMDIVLKTKTHISVTPDPKEPNNHRKTKSYMKQQSLTAFPTPVQSSRMFKSGSPSMGASLAGDESVQDGASDVPDCSSEFNFYSKSSEGIGAC
jgi:hypothetical protein